MKLDKNFVLRRVVDNAVLVPFGQKMIDFNGMISLNKVGAFLAEKLQEETTLEALVAAVVEKYDVDAETAAADVSRFLDELRANKALAE
ncbi:MAG: PqqD family protein [Thermoguttaceae bacterium]|nr:PqqD family protein [Thermoguttaceae bacterium]MBQ2038155.1 PqqD family protein [Thermoguttaceae bacterium]MBQ2557191.1 PqqD family protein [Thermoguttaceae bacterium]MBQ3821448.1 PqqD family protein [Thermoguttaceae bacterium]MBQ4194911.1 PqqD family protein [Thermoguttaceae bacterium]